MLRNALKVMYNIKFAHYNLIDFQQTIIIIFTIESIIALALAAIASPGCNLCSQNVHAYPYLITKNPPNSCLRCKNSADSYALILHVGTDREMPEIVRNLQKYR